MKKLLLISIMAVTLSLVFTACTKKDVEDSSNPIELTVQQPTNSIHSFRTYYLKQNKTSKGLLDSNNLKLGDTIQYVKFVSYYSEDNGQVNVHEIEAYSNGQNVALNKPATASSTEFNYAPIIGRVNDGDYISRWSSDRNDTITKAPFIIIDLTTKSLIDSVRLYLYQTGIDADTANFKAWKQTFTLYTSKNSVDWDSIGGGVRVTCLNF